MHTKHLVFFVIVIFVGPASSADDTTVNNPREQRETRVDIGESPFRLYHHVRKYFEEDNLCFSPSSISLTMGAIYLGAAGNTQAEIGNAFDFSGPVQAISLMNEARDANENGDDADTSTLKMATKFWVQKQYALNPLYADIVNDLFGADIEKQDFINAPSVALKEINLWVFKETDGMINRIFGDQDLDALTRFVAINAIFFQGKWKYTFDKNATIKTAFHSEDESSVQMMCRNDHYHFGKGKTFASLELPYSDSNLVMIVFLPDKDVPFSDFENGFSGKELAWHLKSSESIHVELHIPKIESESDVDFVSILNDMGVQKAFTQADFSRLMPTINDRELYLSAVRQKCKIKTDEEGTTAAAVSTAVVSVRSMPKGPDAVFRADRPFIYVIMDKSSRIIHFIGRFVHGETICLIGGNNEHISTSHDLDENMIFSVLEKNAETNSFSRKETLRISNWSDLHDEKRCLEVLVTHTSLSSENVSAIASIKSLKSIAFYGVELPRDGLSSLQSSELENLTIASTAIDDSTCDQIANIRSLHTLGLYYHANISAESIEKILSNPSIKEVTLFDCTGVADLALEDLSKKYPGCLICVRGLGSTSPYNLLNGKKVRHEKKRTRVD